MLHSHNK